MPKLQQRLIHTPMTTYTTPDDSGELDYRIAWLTTTGEFSPAKTHMGVTHQEYYHRADWYEVDG